MKIINYTILALLFLIIAPQKIDAQSKISGQIKDRETKEPLLYCSVTIFDKSDSLITGGVTNDKGYFSMPAKSGIYKLTSSYVGYHTDTLDIKVGRDDVFLGVIKMDVDKEVLKGVEVTGKISEFEIDKEVQLVTTQMRIGSANTTDVLEKINGLAYDRYNNAVKVDGDANIIFLVNGLEKNQDYIKNLSPDRLKEVEIIRNPSGRYALEGYSAIINIILKNDYRGSEIYLQNMAMFDTDNKNGNPLAIDNYNFTYNYTFDKLNIYTKVNGNMNDVTIPMEARQENRDGTVIENKSIGTDMDLSTDNLFNTYTVGMDYYINPKHTISFESDISAFPSSRSNSTTNNNVTHYKNDTITEQYTSYIKDNSETQDITTTLFYIYKINKKNRLNADFTYSNYKNTYTNINSQSNGFERDETGVNKKRIHKTIFRIRTYY